ncbi:hypothetical protein LMG27198_19920 [Methylocystis echinoides]|uniref:Uncharacterized protein n=1 Tax=Methylocystis echinoides TaxID=29468 RepID=A0A9W6GUB5_9HYPH|nr:hypothetical protein LMG27198_19920 [Methylocystis echinoides]
MAHEEREPGGNAGLFYCLRGMDAAKDRDATTCAMEIMKETILADLATRNPIV